MRRIASAAALIAGLALAPASHALEASPPEVVMRATGSGWTLTDTKGMTLYTYDRDVKPGESDCRNACAEKWPPLAAPPDGKDFGDWSVIARADDTRQWAFRGDPLYRYSRDAYVGATFGERPENETWHVAAKTIGLPPDAAMRRTLAGKVLTDAAGFTLYTFDGDKVSEVTVRVAANGPVRRSVMYAVKSACDVRCLDDWHPLEAPWIATPTADWSVVTREDGSKQWAYKGKPLYVHAHDAKPGDHKGDGVKAAWHAAVLEPPPPLPDWVRLQATDGGEIVADGKGMTLYAFEADMNVNRPSGGASERGCNQFCLDLYIPVLAAADAKPVGDWSTMVIADGKRQWAYKGLPLSTFEEDKFPGDIVGTKPYRVWHTISRSGVPMQGAGGG